MSSKILIVDDSLTVRSDLLEAFDDGQLPVLACATLAEAREALATESIGLIILDVLLPDGDGTDLLREIRASPSNATLPVLMLSSEAEVNARIRGLAMGSNDYVGKPYDREYVVARARQLLRQEQDLPGRLQARILVIDDSMTFREQLGDMLRTAGYDVVGASTGEEGLRSAALNRPAAIIVDGILPGIDGATVVHNLRLDAALRQTPCIMLTGRMNHNAELQAFDAGADAYVHKDEDFNVILARLAAVLRSARGANNEDVIASVLGPKKLLAVDDSLTYLEELGAILRGEGYDVILACSGEEALEMLAAQTVDCILLDRLMPGLDGIETCRRIKAAAPLCDIPIIMLTSMEDQESMIEGLSTGADDYVLKSHEIEILKARVRVQLRRKQSEDQNRRIRAELANKELEAIEARAAHELSESRAALLAVLQEKNRDLADANRELLEHQQQIAEKNRQLEVASHLKSEFLANMSHELRTPLNAIIGFSELLKEGEKGKLTSSQDKYVTEIFNGGIHLLALINDILDLSKVESGHMELELEPLNIVGLLQSSLSVIREKAISRHIRLQLDVDLGPKKILADGRKLKQIIYNLLSNAIKFTADGGSLHVSARCVARRDIVLVSDEHFAVRLLSLPNETEFDRFVQLSVEDNGKGIDVADLPQLFEPFLQLGSVLTKQYEGTGLGLALVKRLIELHGGTLGVKSAPMRGSCFVVWIPWRAVDDDASDVMDVVNAVGSVDARSTEIVTIEASKNDKLHVLVVEDDAQAAEILRTYLEGAGFRVTCIEDATAGLATIEKDRPHLIILDFLLPGMSGWEALEHIIKDPMLREIPVIIVSILAEEQRNSAPGAFKVLQKPVARTVLLSAIEELELCQRDGRAILNERK